MTTSDPFGPIFISILEETSWNVNETQLKPPWGETSERLHPPLCVFLLIHDNCNHNSPHKWFLRLYIEVSGPCATPHSTACTRWANVLITLRLSISRSQFTLGDIYSEGFAYEGQSHSPYGSAVSSKMPLWMDCFSRPEICMLVHEWLALFSSPQR